MTCSLSTSISYNDESKYSTPNGSPHNTPVGSPKTNRKATVTWRETKNDMIDKGADLLVPIVQNVLKDMVDKGNDASQRYVSDVIQQKSHLPAIIVNPAVNLAAVPCKKATKEFVDIAVKCCAKVSACFCKKCTDKLLDGVTTVSGYKGNSNQSKKN